MFKVTLYTHVVYTMPINFIGVKNKEGTPFYGYTFLLPVKRFAINYYQLRWVMFVGFFVLLLFVNDIFRFLWYLLF